jgi:uncharacterized protein with NRDE domain
MKFVQRLRSKFSTLFDDIMRVQLILKNICNEEEWKEIKEDIWYDFKKDTKFDEMKEAEILSVRLQMLAQADPFVGKYFSIMWARKNILQQTNDDVEEINAEMEAENQVLAQQQELQMAQQQGMAQQDMQNQLAFNAQQQLAQAHIDKEVEKVNPNTFKREKEGRDHESTMMDKKIELEKVKSKKPVAPGNKKPAAKKTVTKKPIKKAAAAKKPAPKKKTVSEEAKELGLIYVGSNKYATRTGTVTHINENGVLVNYINKEAEVV